MPGAKLTVGNVEILALHDNQSALPLNTVFFTHLHPDHVGWNLSHEGGSPAPTKPLQRPERF